MKTKIKCAIVGLGRIGSTLEFDTRREKPASHAGVIIAHSDCILAGGCDTNEEKRNAFKSAWSCNAVFTNLEEMLTSIKPDILHIATLPEIHKEMLCKAIDFEVPVIICEKPLAANIDEAITMAEHAQKGSSKIIINHERRYALNYNHVKNIINSRKYGKVISITSKVYMGAKRKAGAVLLDDGTHMLDLIRYLIDRELQPVFVSGNPDSRDQPMAALMQADDCIIYLETGTGRDHIVFEIDISFQTGRIVIGNGYYSEYESEISPFYDKMRSLKQKDISFEKTGYFANMFEDAVALFKKEKNNPVSSIDDGLYSLELIDTIMNMAKKS